MTSSFLIYTGILLGLIIFLVLSSSTPHVEGADGYPTGW